MGKNIKERKTKNADKNETETPHHDSDVPPQMAYSSPFPTSLRRRRSPLPPAHGFFAPADLTGLHLIRALASLASSLSSPTPSLPFQRRNARALSRRALTFLYFVEHLSDSTPLRLLLPPPATLCLKELFIHLHRSKTLLDYCSQSSRFWLLLHNPKLSSFFHDLSVEAATLLDVLPLPDLSLHPDVLDHLHLLRRHARRSEPLIDPHDESLRIRFLSFLRLFESGRLPDPDDLRDVFIHHLGLRDARSCHLEIEFLEEQIYNKDEEVDVVLIDGAIALVRYCRFLLFGFGPEQVSRKAVSMVMGRLPSVKGMDESLIAVPKEYCCPISLELMRDPVIVSTGQTYERTSITRWMEEGHNSCPNSGQMLTHKRLIQNRALRSLISQWCAGAGVVYDPPDMGDGSGEGATVMVASRAAVEVNKATTDLLINRLKVGTEEEKTVAARELRLLAKTGKQNRVYIADAGAIPLLKCLLLSKDEVAQVNSVTAILNLSIHEKNKSKVVEVEGCLKSIVGVLRNGWTTEARENAAAALFSLSAVHKYKKLIVDEDGAVEALSGLLRGGTPRGKRDAVTALFNLSTHSDCSERMIRSGVASALVEAFGTEGVVDEAAGALGLLVRRPSAAAAVAKDGKSVTALVGLLRQGSPKGKENAAAALAEMCRSGGPVVTEIVANVPSISGLIQSLLFTGTRRARRKAASLARSFQRYEALGTMPGGLAVEYSHAQSRSSRRSRNFRDGDSSSDISMSNSIYSGGDVSSDVSMVSISVPVL